MLNKIINECDDCGACVKECSFLQNYGSPKFLLKSTFESTEYFGNSVVFECSLCGLCTSVCPNDLPITEAILKVREDAQRQSRVSRPNNSIRKEHNGLCRYEALGSSQLLTLELIPENCTSIFFPGCGLAANHSSVAYSTYQHLKTLHPNLGIVLDCCTRPSHTIGLNDRFEKKFTALLDRLKRNGIQKIYTACPSCYMTFTEHALEFDTDTIYQLLNNDHKTIQANRLSNVTVHDTCVTRNASQIHESIRSLLIKSGIVPFEMEHNRSRTLCCGEGGAAHHISPELAGSWRTQRKFEAKGRHIVTYCAGCSETLGREIPTTHLLELLFGKREHFHKKHRSPGIFMRYAGRIHLKRKLKHNFYNKVSTNNNRTSWGKKNVSLLTLLLLIIPLFYLIKHLVV